MKAKIIIPVAAALAATFAICSFAFGNALTDDAQNEALNANGTVNSLFGINEAAEESKTLNMSDGKVAYLTYSKTLMYGESSRDVYVDADESEYLFDLNGAFVGYISSYCPNPEELETNIGEDAANTLAYEATRKYFGDRADEFDYNYTTYDSAGGSYYATFRKAYGENGFVSAARMSATVSIDGQIMGVAMVGYDTATEFDESLLDGINEKIVRDAAKAQSMEKHGDSFVSFYMENVLLNRDDDGWYLTVTASEKFTDENGETKKENASYRYDL